jgi:hypothetical protein
LPRKTLEKVYKIFERWGLGAIAIPTLLLPPVPMVPFLFAADAMQYPIREFLITLTLGRITRYTLLAFLAARYGRQILAFITRHGHPVLIGDYRVDCHCGLVLLVNAKDVHRVNPSSELLRATASYPFRPLKAVLWKMPSAVRRQNGKLHRFMLCDWLEKHLKRSS